MRRVKLRSLHLFTVQLGMLLRSGVRLVQALQVAGVSESPDLTAAVERVRLAVSKGVSLSKAMENEPHVFPLLYVKLVGMAEQVGALALIFDRLAHHLAHQGTLRRTLVSGMVYPGIVLLLSLGLLGVLRFLLLPSFLGLIGHYGATLPWLTRVVSFDLPPVVWVAVLLVVLGVAEALFLTWRHPGGRLWLQDVFFALPGPGRGSYRWQWCRFSRDLSTLVGAGLPMVRSVTLLAEQPWPSLRVRQALLSTVEGVRQGHSVSEALAQQPGVPRMLTHLMAAGEVSGRLPHLLERFAVVQEEALRVDLETAVKLFEPIVLVVLGLGVGLVLLAAFLPIYQLMLSF